MTAIYLIVFIGGVVLLYLAYQSVLGWISEKANRLLQSGTVKKGDDLLKTELEFAAPNVTADQLLQVLLDHLNLEEEKTIKHTLRLEEMQATDQGGYGLVFVYGNRLDDSFKTYVEIFPMVGSHGSEGTISVIGATTQDGVMQHVDKLGNWRHDVVEAVKAADPAATFSENRPT